jgi:hypothetical protein
VLIVRRRNEERMKGITRGAVALALSCAAALGAAPSVQAQVQFTSTCQFENDTGTVVSSGDMYDGATLVGTVAVCRDGSYNYWGYVGFREKLTASQWAQATLDRQRDGLAAGSVNCDSSGGNGKVLPDQRVCWTPKMSGLSGHYKFLATGEMYSSHTGDQLAFQTTWEFTR